MRTIRASEIGAFLFCQRAWWYRKQGAPAQNQAELAGGSAFHQRHGRTVLRSRLLQMSGWLLLAAALVVLTIGLTIQWLH